MNQEKNEERNPIDSQGFDDLMAGRERVVAGFFKNKAQVAAGRVIPDSVKAEKHREMAEPGSAAKEDQ